jgi:DNA-binding transcriptional ArsR family regulator
MTQMSNQNPPLPGCACICGQTLSPQFFKALGDPNRLALLARLTACCGPRTVSELATCCPIDLSVVSRHLAILREAGILEARKQGKEVHYTVRVEALVRELRAMADALEHPPHK